MFTFFFTKVIISIHVYNIFFTKVIIIFFQFNVGDSIIFIAGPVVVSPSDTIWLRTIFPTSTQIADEKWFITKKDIIRRIKSTDQGVSLKTSQSQPVFQTLEIKPAVEHGGTFHLSVESSGGTLKSNKINVFVDGILFYIVKSLLYVQ